MTAARTAEAITALDVFLNDVKVGTIVRTPGDYNAFSLDPMYRAAGGLPVLSLSLRAAAGGLRKDPRPVAGALPPFSRTFCPKTGCARRWKSTMPAMSGRAMILTC